MSDERIHPLVDPKLKEFRREIFHGLPYAIPNTDRIIRFAKLLTEQERDELNTAYAVFQRLHHNLPFAVSYNLIGAAISWRIRAEFAPTTSPTD